MLSPLPPASEILARVRQVYRECAAYEDTGEVVTVHRYKTGLFGRRIKKTERFSTLFVRPDLFRFDLVDVGYGAKEHWNRTFVWSDGTGHRSWLTVRPQVKEHDTIADACMIGTGARASVRVPDLLMSAADRSDGNDTSSVAGIARAKRIECYVTTVPFGEDQEETLWIACDSGLIVRVEWEILLNARSRERVQQATERMLASEEVPDAFKARVREKMEKHRPWDFPDTKVTTTTTYRPLLNREIAPERFAFTPPFVGPAA